MDVAGNNVSWIPFAQNADTIEKAIAANKLLNCTLLQKFAFLHLQIKLFSTDAPKKMLLFKGHLSQHTYMIFQQPALIMPLWFVTPLATRRMQPQAQLKDCAPQDSEA